MKKPAWLAAVALGLGLPGIALADNRGSAGGAEIEAASWLAGRWIGEGLGGSVEESWAPAVGGQMIGHFALARDGKPVFYELMLLDRHEGGLRLRVKHFDPDFTAWEDKTGWYSFDPLAANGDELKFKGLSLRRSGDRLIATVTLRQKDGTVADHVLRLRRAPL